MPVTGRRTGNVFDRSCILRGIRGIRQAWKRRPGSMSPVLLWLSFSYASYLPFIIWWDPSPEWFIIPNLFLGAFLVYALGALDRRFAVATSRRRSIMAAVNFNSTIGPRRTAASPALTLAKCVAANTHPSDLVLVADWNWTGYLTYFFGRSDSSFNGSHFSEIKKREYGLSVSASSKPRYWRAKRT